MDRRHVGNILAFAAPDSILKGYAQCWVDLVRARPPDREEAAALRQLIDQHSSSTRLSFLVGAAAAPILSRGIPGVPSVKLARRVLSTCAEADFRLVTPLLSGMLSAAPGATMAVAQQDDTREEVGLSQEAKMLGWGAVMLDDHNGTAAAADAWFDWIYDTELGDAN